MTTIVPKSQKNCRFGICGLCAVVRKELGSRLSVGALEALWAELLDLDQDDERHATFAKLKKAGKSKELEALDAKI